MSQSFVCGMRRFDKHRMESLRTQGQGQGQTRELEQRLRQREEQDKTLFGVPATPHTTPVLSGIETQAPPSPLIVPLSPPDSSLGYTPWRTPSVSSTSTASTARSSHTMPGY